MGDVPYGQGPGSYTGWPPKKSPTEQSIFQDFALINSYLFSPCWVYRASFPHYNTSNTKIIKFGWELFILWVISYGLSFSGFARFPEFRGTINDSFGRPKIERVLCSVIVYCLTRIYNLGTSLALTFLCSWMNAGTCWRMCCWSRH